MFTRKKLLLATISLIALTTSTPAQTEIPVGNLRVWFKANDGVTKNPGNPEVASWANRAPGISMSATPATHEEKPILVEGAINHNQAVRFNGLTNILKTPAFDILAGANDFSVFVVAKPATNQNASAAILDHDFRGTITPQPLVRPISVVSRKNHGASGSFDISLPVTGTPGIECRIGGTNNEHQIVFSFARSVTHGGASVASGLGVSRAPVPVAAAHR